MFEKIQGMKLKMILTFAKIMKRMCVIRVEGLKYNCLKMEETLKLFQAKYKCKQFHQHNFGNKGRRVQNRQLKP